MIKRIFSAAKKDTTLELLVYETLGEDWFGGGVTAKNVAAQIKAAGDFSSISMRINSPGGSAFEGVAIANLLRAQGKPIAVSVDGVAASAASILAMCGDTIEMGTGAMMMIHNAWTVAAGDANAFRAIADTLDLVCASVAEAYTAKTGKTLAEVQALMDAETWMSAEEAVRQGFADSVVKQSADETKQARALAASFKMQYPKAPAFEQQEPEPESEILPDPVPQATTPVDWEGQLSVLRRRLDLAGK
jgi:ATP-dependent protease ClpP protease subunit